MSEHRYWSTDLQRWVYPGEVTLPMAQVARLASGECLHYYAPEDVLELVLAERERCAKACEGMEDLAGAIVHDIARAIREGRP